MFSATHHLNVELPQQLLAECRVMAQYALTSGKKIPPSTVQFLDYCTRSSDYALNDETLEKLVTAHSSLTEIVKPARPDTLLLLADTTQTSWLCRVLGPVALIRQLTVIAVVFVVLFITLTVFQFDDSLASSRQDLAIFAFLRLLYYLAAAGLGAAFAALFKANGYIVAATFRLQYAFSYWIRFTLGLVAGLLLATFVPVREAPDSIISFSPALLALLGGFSASVLYRILTRLIDALEWVVQGQNPPHAMSPEEQPQTAEM
jgi:hypothetical protein